MTCEESAIHLKSDLKASSYPAVNNSFSVISVASCKNPSPLSGLYESQTGKEGAFLRKNGRILGSKQVAYFQPIDSQPRLLLRRNE